MATFVQTDTITVDGIDFDATFWFDDSDNTVDIEAYAGVESKWLVYPGSSLVDCEANAYTLPISEWDTLFAAAARDAIAWARENG